jgi:hypothetical protein
MKRHLYLYVLSLSLVLISILDGNTQTTYQLKYDYAGNRTSRAVIDLKSATISADTIAAKQAEKPLEDLIGDQKIKIYPNPTKGLLQVQIPQTDEIPATLQVFTLRGVLLHKANVVDEITEIDLSGQLAGMYILKILIGDQSSDWKIIKD